METAPRDALLLNSSVTRPVCSPDLLTSGPPLPAPADLRHHVLLHTSLPDMRRSYVDWEMWLTAVGLAQLRPAGIVYFSQFEQMIQATTLGQGIALGMSALVKDHLRSGALASPFPESVAESRACFPSGRRTRTTARRSTVLLNGSSKKQPPMLPHEPMRSALATGKNVTFVPQAINFLRSRPFSA